MAKIVKRSATQNAGRQNEDRLSGLSDSLLHHILSFLEIKNVIQTCLLAKRWTDLWCSFPFINLLSNSTNQADFVKFSELLLLKRDGSKVDTLRVHCNVDVANDVNSWIIYVLKRNVQVLDIQFDSSLEHNNGQEESLVFTRRLFTCLSLRVLKLKLPHYHQLKLPNDVYLPCLEILYFEMIFVDDCCTRLISSCPRLRSLTMHDCKLLMDLLSISSPQLENLDIFTLAGSDSHLTPIEISAPRLITLKIMFWEPILSIRTISDFPYLLNVDISETKFCSLASYSKLLIALRNVQYLTLCSDFLSDFARMLENEPHADKWIPCTFNNLKLMDLGTSFVTCEVLVIYRLLMVSPDIETLILHNDNENGEDNPVDITAWSKRKLYCLKRVTLYYFCGLENEINLLKFFIENAENLEKLTLFHASECVEELAELTKILVLACPRRGKFSLDNRDKDVLVSLTITFV